MGKRARIPDRGDVTPALVAQRLGLSAADFEAWRAELERRGFPTPDSTTGRYCIEAVDRWRLRRHPKLFPEFARVQGRRKIRAGNESGVKSVKTTGRKV
jgi:hypothetical protein